MSVTPTKADSRLHCYRLLFYQRLMAFSVCAFRSFLVLNFNDLFLVLNFNDLFLVLNFNDLFLVLNFNDLILIIYFQDMKDHLASPKRKPREDKKQMKQVCKLLLKVLKYCLNKLIYVSTIYSIKFFCCTVCKKNFCKPFYLILLIVF